MNVTKVISFFILGGAIATGCFSFGAVTKLCRPSVASKTLVPYVVSFGDFRIPSAGEGLPQSEFQLRFQVIQLAPLNKKGRSVRGFPTGSIFTDPSQYSIEEDGDSLYVKASAPCKSVGVDHTCSFELEINQGQTRLDVNYFVENLTGSATNYTTAGEQNKYLCQSVPERTWFAGMDWSCIAEGTECVLPKQ